jgi:hypothetical protein
LPGGPGRHDDDLSDRRPARPAAALRDRDPDAGRPRRDAPAQRPGPLRHDGQRLEGRLGHDAPLDRPGRDRPGGRPARADARPARRRVRLGRLLHAVGDAARARLLVDLGRRGAEQGRIKKADAHFARAAALRPDDPQLFLDSGWWVAGPHADDLATACPPEVAPDPSLPVAGVARDGGPAPRPRWQTVATVVQGAVDLAGSCEPSEHISAYALVDVWSTPERDAVLLIGSDDLSRVWLNGELVHEFRSPDNTATGPDAFRVMVRLRAGRNRLLARVTSGLSPHRLYLRILTDPAALLDARAEDLARSGLWSAAAAALEEADRLRPAGAPGRMPKYATALLMAGDRAGYRRLCGSICDRARDFTQTLAQNNLAWARALAPGADDPGVAVRLAESALTRAATPAAAAIYLNTLGAELYRAARLDEARRRRLEEGIAERGGREQPEDWAFLAMIHHRQGDRDGALGYPERLAGRTPEGGNFWGERQVELLCREAEALVRPVLPDLPADVFTPARGTR